MKLIKSIILFVVVAVLCNCSAHKEEDPTPLLLGGIHIFYDHRLNLCFQDESGNDLLEGIDWNVWQSDKSQEENEAAMKKNEEMYMLDMVFPEAFMNPVWTHYNIGGYIPDTMYGYRIGLVKLGGAYEIDNNYCLTFFPDMSNMYYNDKNLSPAEKIIYKLSFPSLFGDDKVYEIVTYWKPQEKYERNQLCYSIEFNGKDYKEIVYYRNTSIATLVLDR